MRLTRILWLVVASLILGLTPAAFATPPDPTWLAGYWDDADFDDVVILITGQTHAVAIRFQVESRPFGEAVRLLRDRRLEVVVSAPRSKINSRAPPLGS